MALANSFLYPVGCWASSHISLTIDGVAEPAYSGLAIQRGVILGLIALPLDARVKSDMPPAEREA